MKNKYDRLSQKVSSQVMYEYSTSFYYSTLLLSKKNKKAIYSLYGFVRLADEIVDSFHDFDRKILLDEFESEFARSIKTKISINPIMNSFQKIYHDYNFDYMLVKSFINSMRIDIGHTYYDKETLNKYIHGSAEVVGLMCLKIFVNGEERKFTELKNSAISLGTAFQKVNFLRDLKYDTEILNRNYFNIDSNENSLENQKEIIIDEIKKDFKTALINIKRLNKGAQIGVFAAYLIFFDLLKRIEQTKASEIFKNKVSVPKSKKVYLLIKSIFTVVIN